MTRASPSLVFLIALLAGGQSAHGQQAVRTDWYGDPLPTGALARFGTVRLTHGGPVQAVTFSPDGKLVASASAGMAEPVIALWDVAGGKQVHRFAGVKPARQLLFSPDGRFLVSRGEQSVQIWDVAKEQQVRPLPGAQALTFCDDGRSLTAVHANFIIQTWERQTGTLTKSFDIHIQDPHTVMSACFSKDGRLLTTLDDQGFMRLVDLAAGKVRWRREASTWVGAAFFANESFERVALSPDGTKLATAHADRTVRLWDAGKGEQVHGLPDYRAGISCLAFAPDNKTLASVAADNVILLLDTETRTVLMRLPRHGAQVLALDFSRDGRLLASAGRDNTVTIWDVKTGKPLHPFSEYKGWVSFVSFAPDGKTVRTGGLDGKIRFWDAVKGNCLREFDAGQERGRSAILTPDGKRLVTGDVTGHIAFWDLESGKQLKRFGKHDGAIWTLAFALEGKILASAGKDLTIRLWDLDKGIEWKRLGGNPFDQLGMIHFVSFSPDGATLASCGSDAAIRLWDVPSGKERLIIREQEATVEAVVFSPDGKLLASAGWNQPLRLWNPWTGTLVHEIAGVGTVMRLLFSADGRLLAAGTAKETRVWETATWQERFRFAGHQGQVVGLDFSRDSKRLLSGSADCTALVWDVTGRMSNGDFPALRLSAKELTNAWKELADSDGRRAHRAIWSLVAGGQDTVAFLRQQIRPFPPLDEKQLAQWIADLDSERFAARAKAALEIEKLGPLAGPALKRALAGSLALEARQRMERLLQKLETPFSSAEDVRLRRTMEALLHLGTPEARQFLEELAAGAAGARLTDEARLSLRGLGEKQSR